MCETLIENVYLACEAGLSSINFIVLLSLSSTFLSPTLDPSTINTYLFLFVCIPGSEEKGNGTTQYQILSMKHPPLPVVPESIYGGTVYKCPRRAFEIGTASKYTHHTLHKHSPRAASALLHCGRTHARYLHNWSKTFQKKCPKFPNQSASNFLQRAIRALPFLFILCALTGALAERGPRLEGWWWRARETVIYFGLSDIKNAFCHRVFLGAKGL